MFTFDIGKNGEIAVFFCGTFVATCDNWKEVEEEESLFLNC